MKQAMPKPKLIQKPGNVYHTPTETPTSTRIPPNVDPLTGEIVGKRMEHQSHSNVDSWHEIFVEMGEACPDRTRRRRTR